MRSEFQTLLPLVKDFLKENDIYLFGPMGVGKTTFVSNLRQLVDANYVSIGDITRQALTAPDADPTYSKRVRGRIPLAAVQAIISPYLNPNSTYILDGVPRHSDEAEWIKAHILNRPYKAVALTLSASDRVIFERIRQRSLHGSRSETAERIARRLEVYKSNYKIVLDILKPVLYKSIELDTSYLLPGEVTETLYEAIKEL
jgi:adenylate kinase family enzyme